MKKGLKFFKKINWKILVCSAIAVYATAFFGSLFTSAGVKSFWFSTIRPSITPPNWVFPLVWNILFFMIFLSLYLSLTSAKNKKVKCKLEIVFGINLILNFLWSFFYFWFRNPLLAFFDLVALESSILILIYLISKISRKASLLLIPYFIWVAFAGLLNYLSI